MRIRELRPEVSLNQQLSHEQGARDDTQCEDIQQTQPAEAVDTVLRAVEFEIHVPSKLGKFPPWPTKVSRVANNLFGHTNEDESVFNLNRKYGYLVFLGIETLT
jgi:hypothetical protein